MTWWNKSRPSEDPKNVVVAPPPDPPPDLATKPADKVWDVPWRWKCWSCYAACGEDRHLFKTIWARREDLGERGGRDRGGWCTPSSFQQDEIREHAKQHEIMWSWVRGLK